MRSERHLLEKVAWSRLPCPIGCHRFIAISNSKEFYHYICKVTKATLFHDKCNLFFYWKQPKQIYGPQARQFRRLNIVHHTREMIRPFHVFISRRLCPNEKSQSDFPIDKNYLWRSIQHLFHSFHLAFGRKSSETNSSCAACIILIVVYRQNPRSENATKMQSASCFTLNSRVK